jgi:DNA ligase (NAD+)
MDIHTGDTVFVEKGGEIIPKITGVDTARRPADAARLEFPADCPECGTPLIRNDGEAAWYCPNESGCRPQITGKLEHFISRRAMNIDSLGEGKIGMLFDQGLIRTVADLYELNADMLVGVSKTILSDSGAERKVSLRDKSVARILKGIDASKSVPFDRVIFALGMRYVGETTSKQLAAHFGTVENLANATLEMLTEVEGVGGTIAQSIHEWFRNPASIEIITRLKQHGLRFSSGSKERLSDKLAGKKVVVTGTFSSPERRKEIEELIGLHGGRNISSVSKSTSFIVAGQNMGPEKLKKAQELGIPMLSEGEFKDLLR